MILVNNAIMRSVINSHALLFMLGGIFMTHEQFEKAADYWKNKGIVMPKEELKKRLKNI